MSIHDLYTDADADRPPVICDANGSVVLSLCKRCGKGESQLDGPCERQKAPPDRRMDRFRRRPHRDCGPLPAKSA